MEKTINLKEILLSKVPEDCYWKDMGNLTNCPEEHVLEAMKEACKQILELAADNAEPMAIGGELLFVKRKSITDTFNNILPTPLIG